MKRSKRKTALLFSVCLSLLLLSAFSFADGAKLGQKPLPLYAVQKQFTVADLQDAKILKTEEFKQGEVVYTRNYTTEDQYFITAEENKQKMYYVNLLAVYPLVRYSESFTPDWVSAKLAGKSFVKMYGNSNGYFITEYQLEDKKIDKYLTASGEEISLVHSYHFLKVN